MFSVIPTRWCWAFALSVLALDATRDALLAAAPASGVTLNDVPLGPVIGTGGGHYDPRPISTRYGTRTLVAAAKGSRVQAYVDGQPGPVVNAIPVTQSRPLPEGGAQGSPLFSPDEKRVAYIVSLDNGKSAVVVDGTQSPIYDNVSWLGFAPVGHHFAYIAQIEGRSTSFVVDDGKAGLMYQNISPNLAVFSPDGQHFAYVGFSRDVGSKPIDVQAGKMAPQAWCVVLDGVQQKHYENIGRTIFSKDSKHLAYLAGIDGLNFTRAVIGGRESPVGSQLDQLVISDDASRNAYVVSKGGQSFDRKFAVIDNGKEGAQYTAIQNLCVSHDGQHVAYVALNGQGQSIVVDNGKPSPQYMGCQSLQISPDSKNVVYTAIAAQGQFVVVNGQEFGPFRGISSPVVFSEDGGHWACCVSSPNETFAVLQDGKAITLHGVAPGTPVFQPGTGRLMLPTRSSYNGAPAVIDVSSIAAPNAVIPSIIVYSPNMQHNVKVITSDYGTSQVKQKIAIDDQPPSVADYTNIRNIAINDDGRHVAFIGEYIGGNGKPLIHAIHDGAEGPGYFRIDDLALSPDGQHVAYVVEQSNGHGIDCFVVIDGLQGSVFQDVLGITPYVEGYRRLHFAADGSLHFLPVFNGQLHHCWYSADAFKGVPSLAAHEAEKPGPRDLHKFEGPATAIHMVLAPDETIYGVSTADGKFKHGTLFKLKTDGSGFTILHDFYGGDDDGENPMSLLLAADGSLFGTLERKVFHYDPKSKQYAMLNITTRDVGPDLLEGFAADGSIVGFCGFGRNEKAGIFSMAPDGSNYVRLENGQFGKPLRLYNQIVAGKDGTLFATALTSIVKFKSLKDEPVLVHKFVNAPTDGNDPDANVVLDSKGNLYGTTARGGMSQHGVIYKVDADGSNYQVVYNPDEFAFSKTFVPGDDGMLYGIAKEGLLQLAPDGSGKAPTTLIAFEGGPYTSLRGATPNLFFHNGAVYGLQNKAVYKMVLPQAGARVAAAAPTVTINTVQPQPLVSEAFTFTEPTGTAVAGAPPAAPPAQQTPQQPAPQPATQPQPQPQTNQIDKNLKKAQDAANRLRNLLGH